MVATPFKTFSKVYIVQQPIHITLSQKQEAAFFSSAPLFSVTDPPQPFLFAKDIYNTTGQNSTFDLPYLARNPYPSRK